LERIKKGVDINHYFMNDNVNMWKKPYKFQIVAILFVIIIALAINTQPTQASLPGQTVPTVKPKPPKTKSGSGGHHSSYVSSDTSMIEGVIPSITAQAIFNQTQPAVQKTFIDANSFTVTPTYLHTLTPTPTVTRAIQSIRTGTPAGFTERYNFLIFLVALVIVGIILASRRKNQVPSQS
jgi:hypothetical protein